MHRIKMRVLISCDLYNWCRFETILFKLEVLDHKARERAGVITPTLGSPIPVVLTFDAASEVRTNTTCLHFSIIY